VGDHRLRIRRPVRTAEAETSCPRAVGRPVTHATEHRPGRPPSLAHRGDGGCLHVQATTPSPLKPAMTSSSVMRASDVHSLPLGSRSPTAQVGTRCPRHHRPPRRHHGCADGDVLLDRTGDADDDHPLDRHGVQQTSDVSLGPGRPDARDDSHRRPAPNRAFEDLDRTRTFRCRPSVR